MVPWLLGRALGARKRRVCLRPELAGASNTLPELVEGPERSGSLPTAERSLSSSKGPERGRRTSPFSRRAHVNGTTPVDVDSRRRSTSVNGWRAGRSVPPRPRGNVVPGDVERLLTIAELSEMLGIPSRHVVRLAPPRRGAAGLPHRSPRPLPPCRCRGVARGASGPRSGVKPNGPPREAPAPAARRQRAAEGRRALPGSLPRRQGPAPQRDVRQPRRC